MILLDFLQSDFLESDSLEDACAHPAHLLSAKAVKVEGR
jgi:hypothetical protein